MLIKFFRGTGPVAVILILLTAIGVWVNAIINHHQFAIFQYDINPMPLYSLLRYLLGNNALYGVIFSFMLVIFMSLLIVNFNTSHFFINERTFLPGVIYVLFTGLFPHYQQLNPILPASVFLMLAIRRIMDAYRISGTAFNFFDASILIGTGSLFYANLIWFALLPIIGIAILRTGNFKELIISIIGLLTPAILTLGIYYSLGKNISAFPLVLYQNLFVRSGEYYFSGLAISGLIILGLILSISLIHLFFHLNSKKIKARKTFTELIWALIISIAVYFVLPSASVEIIWVAAIPASYIFAHYFIFSRKRLLPEIFFIMLFIIIACAQLFQK
jgi:Family of unknown function (DUF6427)